MGYILQNSVLISSILVGIGGSMIAWGIIIVEMPTWWQNSRKWLSRKQKIARGGIVVFLGILIFFSGLTLIFLKKNHYGVNHQVVVKNK